MNTHAALGLTAVAGLLGAHAAAKRAVTGARTRPQPAVLAARSGPPARRWLVSAPDGTGLAVDEWGDPDAPVTVVLSHGWTLSSHLWHRQIASLSADARVIAWDHRGHGRSERSGPEGCTLPGLGGDLAAVIDNLVPEGRLVLAGHSMGGMTIMHLAEQRPDLVDDRVDGVVIVSSSPGDLAAADFGLPLPWSALVKAMGPRGMAALGRLEAWSEKRQSLAPELWLATRALSFGTGAPAHMVDEMLDVVETVPLGVVSAFYAGLAQHDGHAGLDILSRVPVTILVGIEDRLTPVAHSRRIAELVPSAELVTFERAGHMLTLERADEVTKVIAGHVQRSRTRAEMSDLVASS